MSTVEKTTLLIQQTIYYDDFSTEKFDCQYVLIYLLAIFLWYEQMTRVDNCCILVGELIYQINKSYGHMKKIETDSYLLEFTKDQYYVLLKDKVSAKQAQLFLFSSVHSTNGLDDTTQIGEWQVDSQEGEVLLFCVCSSSCWRQKKYWIRCGADCLHYGIEVEGDGAINEVQYFGGYCSGLDRWGSGFFCSEQSFQQGWTPEPNTREKIYFPADGSEGIDLNGVPVPGRDGWFFTPPPFCFAFETASSWLGLGLCCKDGENRYVEYRYQGGDRKFNLSLTYEGHTTVHGSYRLPEIGIYFASDPYKAMTKYVADIRQAGLVPLAPKVAKSLWWQAPIYCGWGSQCYLASLEDGFAPQYATQVNYDRFMLELDERDIHPGTVVIDDKWQVEYGLNTVDFRKWPDLAGFIRQRHERGQKVLLWLKFWDAEGLPETECVVNAAGKRLAVDPSNPRFERRFRDQIRFMLSPGGLDADGFKVDFSARIPSGPALKTYRDLWGLELMKCYFEILHSEAKRIKADALIIAHAPNPYLAPYIDMIRLNDINVGQDLIVAMRHRQKVAHIAMPEALIDTDNWQMTDK
ncbi:MAG: hypothetical protein JW963_18890, partial [Anaerolineales bacterium]|nr:hypothetical protein [Anaerolineales bacterium]